MQAASMTLDRNLLRRGARKMQDGNLGRAATDDEEEPVNIHIGDQVFTQTAPVSQQSEPAVEPASAAEKVTTPLWQKAAATAALLAGGAGVGAGVPWLAGLFDRQPAAVERPAPADSDTRYELSITPEQK